MWRKKLGIIYPFYRVKMEAQFFILKKKSILNSYLSSALRNGYRHAQTGKHTIQTCLQQFKKLKKNFRRKEFADFQKWTLSEVASLTRPSGKPSRLSPTAWIFWAFCFYGGQRWNEEATNFREKMYTKCYLKAAVFFIFSGDNDKR